MSVLSGRRALVTGGSRGIGAAIVRRLAADGAMVAFTYAASPGPAENLRAEVSARGGTAVAIKADSADAQQVTDAVDQAVRPSAAWISSSTTPALVHPASSNPSRCRTSIGCWR